MLVILIGFPPPVQSQTVPDAGSLLQQIPDGHSKCPTYGQSNCSTPTTVN